jgi:hypothetical protein
LQEEVDGAQTPTVEALGFVAEVRVQVAVLEQAPPLHVPRFLAEPPLDAPLAIA